LNEVLLLVLRFAVAPLANDGLGELSSAFLPFKRGPRVVVLDLGPTACSAVAPSMYKVAPSLLAPHTGPNALAFEQRATRLRRLLCLGFSWHAHICMDLDCQKQMRVD